MEQKSDRAKKMSKRTTERKAIERRSDRATDGQSDRSKSYIATERWSNGAMEQRRK